MTDKYLASEAVMKAVRMKNPEAAMRGIRRLANHDAEEAVTLAGKVAEEALFSGHKLWGNHRNDSPMARLLTMSTAFIVETAPRVHDLDVKGTAWFTLETVANYTSDRVLPAPHRLAQQGLAALRGEGRRSQADGPWLG